MKKKSEKDYEEFFGKTFRNWTILDSPIKKAKGRRLLFLARCNCGQEKHVTLDHLKNGKAKICISCINKKTIENPEELIGRVFGKWKVIGEKQKIKSVISVFCECVCGERKFREEKSLLNGTSKQCARCTNTKGSYLPHKLRRIWTSMKDRCKNNKRRDYKNYGGRGINVCDRWANSFENFLEDMGERPSEYHEIDRINNDGNYEPSNCRWVTPSENMLNRRCSKKNRIIKNDV